MIGLLSVIVDRLLNNNARRKLNWAKTFLFNFRFFPVREAIRFPVLCYGPVKIVSNGGKVILKQKTKGTLKIGYDLAAYRNCGTTVLKFLNESELRIEGEAIIMQGASIVLGPKSTLTLKNRCTIGDRAEIICRRSIEIGEHSEVTWDCQVTDFASHPTKVRTTNLYQTIYRPVIIGDYCWIGNRTTIQPGTKLPDRIIVASNSLLNKDYQAIGIPKFSIIGGIPAKLLKTGIERNYEKDYNIRDFFFNHPEIEIANEVDFK